jgi:hypothetical protein
MYKFGKIIFLPSLLAMVLACSQYLKSENRQSPEYILDKSELDSCLHNKYSWMSSYSFSDNLVNRIPLPKGFSRIPVEKNSYADWLRHLPLKQDKTSVHLYNGELKSNQEVHHAIIDIDAGGSEDLQQCADACMRLKAEYLYSTKQYDKIMFNFTSGHEASWNKWREGFRPKISGNNVTWVKTAQADSSYKNFKSYMKTVFRYAGTFSLDKQMTSVQLKEMKPGDLFIKGGFPGHAVIIVDIAENKTTGKKIFMIAQSYMPAQDIHILKNYESDFSPWYSAEFGERLDTPEWTFYSHQLKR